MLTTTGSKVTVEVTVYRAVHARNTKSRIQVKASSLHSLIQPVHSESPICPRTTEVQRGSGLINTAPYETNSDIILRMIQTRKADR